MLFLHLVLGLPCRLVHSRGVHSVTLFVHLLSLNPMCPVHPCIPFLITSMISFTPVWCRIQVLRLWSRRVMPSMMRSILRCATDSSSMWAFLSAHVSLPYTMTVNTYSLCTFLFTFILAVLNAAHTSAMRLLILGRRSPACVTVLPRYTHRSNFSMVFPSTATVDVVALSLSITLVLLRFMLRPTGLLARCMSVSMLSSSSGDLATRTISSAKIKCDRCSPSILINLSSQLILLIMASCRHAVKSLGEMLSPCLTPLCSLILSLSLWSFRVDVAPL